MPEATAGTTLLEPHLPVLSYDSQGSFLADSPATITNRITPTGEGNALKRADGSVIANGRRRQAPAQARARLPRMAPVRGRRGGGRSGFLDAAGRDYVLEAREMHRGSFADRIYGHAIPADDGGWWLQYRFFYLYNNKAFIGFGLHEGDWAMV
jgi:hypothetical protein